MDLGLRAGVSTLQNISSYKYHPLFHSPNLVWEAEICCNCVVYKLEGRGSIRWNHFGGKKGRTVFPEP